jgi:hypothetical protein
VNGRVANALAAQDTFISPQLRAGGGVPRDAAALLKRQAQKASTQGVREKLALVEGYPRNFSSPSTAADGLLQYLSLSGVLVLVSPRGLGVSSDDLSPAQISSVVRTAKPFCSRDYASCAVAAGSAALVLVRANQAQSQHSTLVFWVATVAGILALAALLTIAALVRRRRDRARAVELRG